MGYIAWGNSEWEKASEHRLGEIIFKVISAVNQNI